MGKTEGLIMAKTEKIELTTLCMVYQGDELLLQNRVKKDWRGYAFPGGHVEPDESIVDATIREIREETGLTIAAPKLCGIKQFPTEEGRYLVFLFKTDRFTGELSSSEEGEMRWVRREDLPNIQTVADFMQLLSVFDREDLTEFLYVPNADDWDIVLK